MNRSTIEKIEGGKPPSVLQLYAISKAVEFPFESLAVSIVKEQGAPLQRVGALPRVTVTTDEAKRIAVAYDRADRETKRVIARLLVEEVDGAVSGGKGGG
jgi:hypothetical protein